MKYVLTGILAVVLAGPAAATSLRITVENTAGPTGFALTPLYGALHDENFDAFDEGASASQGVRELAELGSAATLAGERQAATTGSIGFGFPFVSANGPRPIFGGESVTQDIEVTDTAAQRYFTFLSMIIPSNDLFIGSDQAIEIFDGMGNFNGPQTITLTGIDVYDAGTEINDPMANPAFVAGVPGVNPLLDPNDPSLGSLADENGEIRDEQFAQLRLYAGLETAAGFTTAPSQNLFGDASSFNIARITIEQIAAPVPLPAGGALLVSGLVAAGAVARRKAAKKAAG